MTTRREFLKTGLAGGMLVSRVVSGYVRAAEEREQRFRGLLTIAADAYWEIDDQYRLVTFKRQGRAAGSMGEIDAIAIPHLEVEAALDLLGRSQRQQRPGVSETDVGDQLVDRADR